MAKKLTKKERKEMIDTIIEEEIASYGSGSLQELYEDAMENGIKGYKNYSDSQLKKAYKDRIPDGNI